MVTLRRHLRQALLRLKVIMISDYILANLCNLSYLDHNSTNTLWKVQLADRAAQFGLSEVIPAIRGNHELFAGTFFGRGTKYRVYVFRGTEVTSILDILTDLKAKRQRPAFLHSKFKVAESFAEAADVLEPFIRMDASLHIDSKLVFAGHSLGGAIATITAERFSKDSHVHKLFTLGCPRVGNSVFAAVLEERLGDSIVRYQNRNDPICLMPFKRWNYCHAGRPHYFTSSNTKAFTGDMRLPEEYNDWHQRIDRMWQVYYTLPYFIRESRKRHSCLEYINLIKVHDSLTSQ